MLTPGVDMGKDFVGTDRNDIFEADGTTLTAFDKIDGAAGIDTLQIIDAAGVMGTANPVGMEIVNVEKMTVQTAGSFGQVTAGGTSAVPGVKQVDTISFAGPLAADSYTVDWNGAFLTTAVADGTNNATLVANAINAAAGYTAASVVGTSVVITAPSAGTSQMPTYTITNNDDFAGGATYQVVGTTAIFGADAVEATGATTAAVYDVSGIADLTDVKVTTAVNVNLKAAATTNVDVSGTTGAVEVDGGKNVVVTDAKNTVTLDNAKGNVTVTDATQAHDIIITDGANVTVTATSAVDSGDITIGGVNGNATGDVVVTQNLNSTGAAALAGGTIDVTGGKTVTVDVNSTNSATGGVAAITTGTINVTGDANTTAVTVNQTEAVTAVPSGPATPAVTEVASVEFTPLTSGSTTVLGGLTFTASKNLTAAEVAAAFANLKAGATHGQAKADNGIYTGTFSGEFTSGAVSADNKVVFTATEAKLVTSLVDNGSADVTITTNGATGTDAVTAVGAITNGAVVIADAAGATDTIKTVTVDGYAAGSSITSNALTDVTLKNSSGTATINSTVASLNLTVDDVNSNLTLTALNLKTLNLTTTGEESVFGLISANTETLTIAAAADLDIATGSNLAALKTVTISGTGNVDLGDISGATTTALTSTTIGDVSAIVDGTKATVTTGEGNDTITVDAIAGTITKTISLGGGDDKLILSGITAVNADTAAISGGAGTDDTLVLISANAADTVLSSLPNSIVFNSKVTGFEKLEIVNAGSVAVNVGNLGFNYVITAAVAAGALTLKDMENDGTVELNKAVNLVDSVVVQVKDAAAGVADVLNVKLNAENAGENAGTLTVDDVETINISTVDLDTDKKLDAATTLGLSADKSKTVAIEGNADLTLNITTSTTVTKVDAHALNGALIYTADDNTTAGTEVIGGAGDDELTASGDSDILNGGAGNDYLVSDDYATLIGGTGADIFEASIIANKDALATITDFNKAEGDSIKFAGAAKFINTAVATNSLNFEAALNKAVDTAGANEVTWFQFTSNSVTDTYLVYNAAAGGAFDVTADMVIKVAGVVDFSTAAFNNGNDTIAFA